MTVPIRLLVVCLLTATALSLAPVRAQAQVASRACKDVSDTAQVCQAYDGAGTPVGAPLPPVIWRIGEGVVRVPQSELAYLTLANYGPVPVAVLLRYLVDGQGLVTEQVVVPALTRVGWAVHADPYVAGGGRAYSLRVYAPDDSVDVALVLRSASDPWGHVSYAPLVAR